MNDLKIRILVLEAGFVMVCRCPDPTGYPFWLPYSDMKIIRRWGTSQGLGELCDGPTETTTLDAKVSEGTCPVRAIINILECSEKGLKKWEKELGGQK
jgi:hypothetical protein